jgi:large subunit ribosomal protein L5
MKSRLEELYTTSLKLKLKDELKLANIMQVPRVSKVVLNIGIKEAVGDSRALQSAKEILETSAGQAAVKTKARKSIAGFKLREGTAIGVTVTLRGNKMYHFLDKLINIALPGVRDFQGLNPRLDGTGKYNLGITDWMIFPEVDYDKVDRSRGLNITIHTTALNDAEGLALLKAFNMPFRRS